MNATMQDPDETARAVLARMTALRADPPPAPPTVEGVTASLCTYWEIHLRHVPDFPKRFGKRVKAAGGRYSECRGYNTDRFVSLPDSARELANQIVTEAAKDADKGRHRRVTVIAEGSYHYPFRLGDARSWVTVHEVRSMPEAYEAVRKSVEQAIARGLVSRVSPREP